MNTDENGVKYVLSLSSPNKRISLKKVNIKDIPASAMGRIIRCKKISTMRQATDKVESPIAQGKEDDVELTVVSTTENAIIVGDSVESSNNDDIAIEAPQKKIKIDLPIQENNIELSTKLSNESISKALVNTVSNEEEEVEEEEMGLEEYDEYMDDIEEDYSSEESISSSRTAMQVVNEHARTQGTANYKYISQNVYKARRSASDLSEKRKGKAKQFRAEWLNIDIFRDWLDCDPDDPCKARCLACNTVMNAGKSELEKHAAGAKHCRALEQMQYLRHQSMLQQLEVADEGDVRHSDGSVAAQPLILGDAQSIEHREFQVEALNRIAVAVESMSSTLTTVLEKMVANQESMAQLMQQLAEK